eukprot:CAMPEP_0181038616 /NCGR_PEP_ID=MMETSP1070-20121207/10026_1 /TAXON_ID=265543 /ORGANISM="Minutocellus polymorphus, Strain NH13" /LENGTH=489 /DNA_ID=CAMNT_0023116403 /DNA_START=47 /DNA_END=1516 /DNA_ORIENTATION=-
MPRSHRPGGSSAAAAIDANANAVEESSLLERPSSHSGQEVVADWLVGNLENDNNKRKKKMSSKERGTGTGTGTGTGSTRPSRPSTTRSRPRSLSRSRSFMSRTRDSADSPTAPAVETDGDGDGDDDDDDERSSSNQRGRNKTRDSPGKNHQRRRSLSLGRRRSRSRSRSRRRSNSMNDRPSEYGHYAPTPTNDTKVDDDEDEDDDGFDDADGMQVITELGLPPNIPPNDDFLVEDYDPSKHGPGDDFSLSCGTCQSDFEPLSFLQFMQDLMEESKELCTNICATSSSDNCDRDKSRGPMSHVHCGTADNTVATTESGDDDESKTLASNEVPLEGEESRLGAHMRRSQSRILADSDPTAQTEPFNPYGDDSTKDKVASKGLRGMRRSRSKTRSSPSKRSKSMERKLAKWKSAKSKMKNKEMERGSEESAAASPTAVAVADSTDWRAVCDDVLSKCEQGHFVAYEAGRVRSSTKRSNSRTRQGDMERFLYM